MIVIYGTLSNDDIFAKFFFIFSKFWFSGLLGGNRAKNSPKWQEIMSVVLHISGTIHHMIVIFGTQMQNDIARSFFKFFQNFSFSGCQKGERAESGPKSPKPVCRAFVSQEPYITWSSFMVHRCKRIMSAVLFYTVSKF